MTFEEDPDFNYVDMMCTMDAQIWTKEFCKIHKKLYPDFEVNQGWILSWMANAIMRGYDEGLMRREPKRNKLLKEIKKNTNIIKGKNMNTKMFKSWDFWKPTVIALVVAILFTSFMYFATAKFMLIALGISSFALLAYSLYTLGAWSYEDKQRHLKRNFKNLTGYDLNEKS